MNPETPAAQIPQKPNDVRAYSLVWACLMLLTGLTVAAAQMHIGKLAIFVCLAIASIKSVLVLLFFMHLRHARRLLIKLTVPIAIAVLAIFIGLTFTDVIAR